MRLALIALLFALLLGTPAEAAVSFFAGSFTTTTTGTANQSITDPGFAPEACIFTWTINTADGSTATLWRGLGVGVAAAAEWSIMTNDVDGDTTPEPLRRNNAAKAIMVMGGTGTVVREADYAPQALGFDLTWTTNEATARIINYVCVGGDITDAAIVQFQTPGSVSGSPVTYSGVGFQGDLLLLASEGHTAQNALSTYGLFNLGMATSPTERWAISTFAVVAPSSDTSAIQVSTKVLSMLLSATTVTESADFTAWTSDGFQLTYAASAATRWVYGLVLKGGAHALGAGAQRTTTGTENHATTGVNPVGLLVASINQASNVSVQAHDRVSLGAAHSTTQRWAMWGGSQDAQASTVSDSNLDRAAILKMMTEGTPTLNAAADFSAFGAEEFTLDWPVTVDGTAREFVFWAPGDAVGGGPVSGVPTRGLTIGAGR